MTSTRVSFLSQSQPEKSIDIIVDEDLGQLTPFQDFLVSEFRQYKALSLSDSAQNFVAPNEGLQAKNPGVHNLFGRDRVFDRPHSLLSYIVDENVCHVHVDSSGCLWDPTTPQWSCTSHESIVYSAFIDTTGNYTFVIHDMLLAEGEEEYDAHDFYSFDDVKWYVNNAIYHRRSITGARR